MLYLINKGAGYIQLSFKSVQEFLVPRHWLLSWHRENNKAYKIWWITVFGIHFYMQRRKPK